MKIGQYLAKIRTRV